MDVEETPVEVAPEPVVEAEPLDTVSALKQVLKKALCHDGLARGIRECARMLDKRRVHLCVLASSCNEPAYTKLIEALCTEHGINLMKVPDASELGEWAGLCKIDAEGNARKVVNCSCVCVTEYGEQSEALDFLLKDLGK
jgi:small subunit ribosomal protein S12e